jgi:hypothetical protein
MGPNMTGGIDVCLPRLWYNNCNESHNNVIKRDTNWVIQKLLDLVTKLYKLEQDQTRDVRGFYS